MNSSMYTCLLYSQLFGLLKHISQTTDSCITVIPTYITWIIQILSSMYAVWGVACAGTPDSYNWASLIISWCSPAFLESLGDIQKTSHSGDLKVYCLHRQWHNLTFGFSHSFISFIFNTCHPAVLTQDIGFLMSLHLLSLTFNQGYLAPVSFQDLYIMWNNVIKSRFCANGHYEIQLT